MIALTKYSGPDGFNNRHYFLIVLEAGTYKIEMLADSVLVKGSLPG